MWTTLRLALSSRRCFLLSPGLPSVSTIALALPTMSDWSLSATRYAPPPMPRPSRRSVSTMLGKLSCVIFGINWMSSGDPSNTPSDPRTADERTADDLARGLEEVVRLNRLQFEAFTDIRKDLQDLTERIKGGNLLLLPRMHQPRVIARQKRRTL